MGLKKENHTNNHSHNTNQTNKIKATKANVVARPSRLPSRPARIALHCLALPSLPCLALPCGASSEKGLLFFCLFFSFLFCKEGIHNTLFPAALLPHPPPLGAPSPSTASHQRGQGVFLPLFGFFFSLPSSACLSSQGVEDSWKELAGGGVQPASRAEPSRAEPS